MKNIVWAVVAGVFPVALAWLGGMDFVRGPDLALAFGSSVAFAAIAYTFPKEW